MNTPKNPVVNLKSLNQKLVFEARRIVREREEGIVKYVGKKANLTGNLRFAYEK